MQEWILNYVESGQLFLPDLFSVMLPKLDGIQYQDASFGGQKKFSATQGLLVWRPAQTWYFSWPANWAIQFLESLQSNRSGSKFYAFPDIEISYLKWGLVKMEEEHNRFSSAKTHSNNIHTVNHVNTTAYTRRIPFYSTRTRRIPFWRFQNFFMFFASFSSERMKRTLKNISK